MDGTNWSALGSGILWGADFFPYSAGVHALVAVGTDLYAAGYFFTAGGIGIAGIARWDGTKWWAIGSGVNGRVRALAADEHGHLFVGGDFTIAGGKVSPFIAQVNLVPEGGLVQNARLENGQVVLDLMGQAGRTYAVQRATDAGFTQDVTTLLVTNAPVGCRFTFTGNSSPGVEAFYRLLKQ